MTIPIRSRFRRIWCVVLLLTIAWGAAPAGADDLPTSHPSGAATGRFLVLSDFHFDPFLGLSREQFAALATAPPAEWPQRLSGQPAPQYGLDSPFALVQSSLDDAKRHLPAPDFILVPGDFLAHGWPAKYDHFAARNRAQDPAAYRAFTAQVMRLLAMQLQAAFPSTPVLPVPGNDDSECGDYLIAPDSPFLKMFAEVWAPLALNPEQRNDPASVAVVRRELDKTVSTGGYYSIRLPTLGNHRLIALNTVFWTPQYRNACGDSAATPALDQLRWLETALAAAERAGEQVWLLMHVPPGIDSFETYQAGGVAQPLWRPELTTRFLQLVQRYEKILQMAIAGHTHRDDFRVVQLEGRPVLLTKVVPSISPVYGNNPGYQIFQYDRHSGTMLNYVTHGLPLTPPTGIPSWHVEYEFRQTYGTFQLTPASIARLGAEISAGGAAQTPYRKFYSVSGPLTPISAKSLGCAILNTTVSGFTECSVSPAGTK